MQRRAKTTSSPGSAAGSAAIYGKKLQLAWTMSPLETAGSTDVFITSTDETGAAVSHPLGTFPAPVRCSRRRRR